MNSKLLEYIFRSRDWGDNLNRGALENLPVPRSLNPCVKFGWSSFKEILKANPRSFTVESLHSLIPSQQFSFLSRLGELICENGNSSKHLVDIMDKTVFLLYGIPLSPDILNEIDMGLSRWGK